MDLKNIRSIYLRKNSDDQLGLMGPVMGKLTRNEYQKIVSLISNSPNADHAKTVSEQLVLIREGINDKISQISLNNDAIQQIINILRENIFKKIQYHPEIDPIEIVFDNYRIILDNYQINLDKKNRCKNKEKCQRKSIPENLPMEVKCDNNYIWRMYSMIIVLDSNLKKTVHNLSGCTVVNLPNNSPYHRMYYLTPHVYPQTRMPMNWVIFPARALHKSIVINQIDGFNMALKFDVWIRKRLYVPNAELYTPFSKECHCFKCRPHKFVVQEQNFWLKLPCVLNTIIAQYAAEPCRCIYYYRACQC